MGKILQEPSPNWKSCDLFESGDEGLSIILGRAKSRAIRELNQFPYLRRYWELEDLTNHLLMSVVDVARAYPDVPWPDFTRLCHRAFTNSLFNVKSRNKSERFGYALTWSAVYESSAVYKRRDIRSRGAIPSAYASSEEAISESFLETCGLKSRVEMTHDEVLYVRERFLERFTQSLRLKTTDEQFDLITEALDTPGESFSAVLSSLGVTSELRDMLYDILKRTTRNIAPLHPEEIYYLIGAGG